MDVTVVYLVFAVVAIVVCASVQLVDHAPTRQCPQCGDRVAQTARACQSCHYRFT